MQHQIQMGADEVVWSLLLQHWESPEAGVVCKLLYCNKALAALVHGSCAGRIHVEMLSLMKMAGHNVWAREPTPLQRWLKRNFMLLRSFAFWPHAADAFADDEPISESLAAQAAAAAQHGAAAGEGPVAALPLQHLLCGVPSRRRVLLGLAALAPHLTSLSGGKGVAPCDRM